MWFVGGLFSRSRTAASSGSGSGSLMNMMSSSLVRHFSRKRGENLRKINPKVAPQEASNIAQDLYRLINQRGPLTISSAWIQAQESGISGLNSKTHLKLMLKWMRGRKMLKLFCNQTGSNKKFLLCTLPEDPQIAQFIKNSELKLQTEKPSIKRKRKQKK
ncbi:hypothetical protein CFP56_024198 [Quercus suber]|uniref:Uncharacterized protein n=1 Tax=Quercus suber TaxID=58331 RepID=A0AAW0KA51_QUESU|nr:uncharacterized protein LOC112024556 [Quercus suber]